MVGETISVIIPCYNAEATVARSIVSVCEQCCKEKIELIVVDDGSTDASADVIKAVTPPEIPRKWKFVQVCISGERGSRRSC